MRKLFIVLGLLVITGAFVSVNAQNNKSVLGEWKYNVAEAPYGYDKGVISIVENEKKLSGEVIFDSGYKVKLSEAALKADTLRLSVYVESEYVTVVLKVKGNKMDGTVDSSQGKMTLKAEKIVPGEKKK